MQNRQNARPLVPEEDEAAVALRLGASILLAILGLLGVTVAYSLRVEPFRLQLTRPRIHCPRLPCSLDGLRVLFLADPHVDSWTRRESDLLEMLEELPEAPELIVWGGDFIFHAGAVPTALQFCQQVGRLFPGVPMVAVLGNAEHKMTRRRRAAFVARLEAAGVTVLNNRQITLAPRGGDAITIAGVDDPYFGHDKLSAALSPVTPAERFTLLLAHSPQIALRAARAGVDMMLSGHTHGGQVRLPLIGPLKTQNPLCRRMDQGLFDRARLRRLLGRDPGGDLITYVSRGIGTAPVYRFRHLQPRLFCRPEVTFLTLHCGHPEKSKV